MKMQDCLVIVPAAGFGKRVGSPEAKELFENPQTGKRLIDMSLDWCVYNKIAAHIITRSEKKSLINHINNTKNLILHDLHVQEIMVEGEWPQTILKSQPFWREYNVVWLPDSDFSPLHIVQEMFLSLKNNPYCFSVFKQENLTEWGAISIDGGFFYICEKPKVNEPKMKHASAWGLFGFQKNFGVELLQAMIDSGLKKVPVKINNNAHLLYLDDFKDLTRSK